MSIEIKQQSSASGVRAPLDTTRLVFVNRATTGTNKTTIGKLSMLDLARSDTNTTTTAKAWSTIVAPSTALHPIVVQEQAKLPGELMKGVVKGPCKAYCYGALAAGDALVPDTTNKYFIKATAQSNVRAFFEGATQTATDALNLCDIVLTNIPAL